MIAEWVTELATHEKLLKTPDVYRPKECPRCGHDRLHVHDHPSRVLANEAERSVELIRFQCASAGCEATWRIIPGFLPRRLWHRWEVVERVVEERRNEEDSEARMPVRGPSEATVQRWKNRLESRARRLVELLAGSGSRMLEAIAGTLGLEASRADLVGAHAKAAGSAVGWRLAAVAGLVHRLARGIRLM